jgi:hypothetical protein
MKKIALLCGLAMALSSVPAQAETLRYNKSGQIADQKHCFWAQKEGETPLFICVDGATQADIHAYPGWGTLFERCVEQKPHNTPWLTVCEERAFRITRYRATHGIIPSDADRDLD